jgi:predicted transposase/invertase (TIGR01784 family)
MLWGEYNYDEDIAAQRQEAFDDGLSKGVSQGIQQGISQGIQQKAIETAKALLSEDISIDVITRTTGLSTETVKQLAKEIEDCKILIK